MSKLQPLRVLVNERLTAAAEEIFALFERTIAEYEEELCRSEQKNQRKGRLLHETPSPSPPGPGLTQVIVETVQIKEEPEEQSIKQEEELLPVFAPENGTVFVETEESPLLQLRPSEHREETQEEDVSSESEGETEQSDTDNDDDWEPPTYLSSNNDNDDDWKSPISPAESKMEMEANGDHDNQVQIRDRSTDAAVNNRDASETERAVWRKHQCSVCKKRFANKWNLQAHFRIHTGERPFRCSICDKAFNQKGALDRHRKIHTGEKPYRCSICKKNFNQKVILEQHKRTHTGERPYSSSLCKKAYANSSVLKAHMRTHTGATL